MSLCLYEHQVPHSFGIKIISSPCNTFHAVISNNLIVIYNTRTGACIGRIIGGIHATPSTFTWKDIEKDTISKYFCMVNQNDTGIVFYEINDFARSTVEDIDCIINMSESNRYYSSSHSIKISWFSDNSLILYTGNITRFMNPHASMYTIDCTKYVRIRHFIIFKTKHIDDLILTNSSLVYYSFKSKRVRKIESSYIDGLNMNVKDMFIDDNYTTFYIYGEQKVIKLVIDIDDDNDTIRLINPYTMALRLDRTYYTIEHVTEKRIIANERGIYHVYDIDKRLIMSSNENSRLSYDGNSIIISTATDDGFVVVDATSGYTYTIPYEFFSNNHYTTSTIQTIQRQPATQNAPTAVRYHRYDNVIGSIRRFFTKIIGSDKMDEDENTDDRLKEINELKNAPPKFTLTKKYMFVTKGDRIIVISLSQVLHDVIYKPKPLFLSAILHAYKIPWHVSHEIMNTQLE